MVKNLLLATIVGLLLGAGIVVVNIADTLEKPKRAEVLGDWLDADG